MPVTSEGATESPDITGMLQAWSGGDRAAFDRLVPLVYPELRKVARSYLRRHDGEQTLQPTALAHEAYVRLLGTQGLAWNDRAHFYAASAQIMRRMLVDAARARSAGKRRAGSLRVTFTDRLPVSGRDPDLVTLDDALSALAALDPRKAQVVEFRFFGGLSVDEVAAVLKISPQSVMRDWKLSKAWLARELGKRSVT